MPAYVPDLKISGQFHQVALEKQEIVYVYGLKVKNETVRTMPETKPKPECVNINLMNDLQVQV